MREQQKTGGARSLRKRLTPAERALWRVLRGHQFRGLHFRRQHPIGPSVTDFCCEERFLIIELDGGVHVSQEEKDRQRQAFLESQGYRVIRVFNNDVLGNLSGVKQMLWEVTEGSSPHPDPPPQAGEGTRGR